MNIAVFGAKGRVGSAVVRLARQKGYGVEEFDRAITDRQAKDIGTAPQNEAFSQKGKIDVAIDFSTTQATQEVCEFCKLHRCALVTGVTGRNAEQQALVDNLKSFVAVEESSNFSVGVAKLKELCAILARLGWDCEIVETHRKGKKDSPSGTAKELAMRICGATNSEEKSEKHEKTRIVTIHSLRCGSNFGKHEVIFATDGESITLTHQAENVEIFARGALHEAEKICKRENNELTKR